MARSNNLVTLLLLLTISIPSSLLQNVKENTIESEDVNPLAEAAAAILREQGAENIGGMVNSFLQGGGAKHLGDMLNSEGAGSVLQGLGSMLGGQGQGIDPNILGAVAGMLSQNANKNLKDSDDDDSPNFLTLIASLLGDPNTSQNVLSFLPMIMQTFNSFTGVEAHEREKSHEDHAWLLPPFLEKLHLLLDHFLHSEMGKSFINTLGAEKFVKIFSDEKGNFSYQKFVELLENHSFRRHWIRMVTNRIALVISYISDPKIQKRYLSSGQHFINSILKSQGYPKSTYFDPNRASETISALINYFTKNSLNMKIESKQYVKPAVEYVKDVFRLAQQKGILMASGVDSRQLSDKLADTINMEIIEPIARVNRAYRFAKKVPKCDRYVMCLVNQNTEDGGSSLPGLKSLLSKSSSLVFSWFLSTQTGTSFWTLYNVITDENNCQARFMDACNDFHIEEVKVTTEYVHNEL